MNLFPRRVRSRDRLSNALGRGTPEQQQKQERYQEEERKRQRELDRDLGWEL